MTIFDMLLTKPVAKKDGVFELFNNSQHKNSSFEKLLLSLLKNEHSPTKIVPVKTEQVEYGRNGKKELPQKAARTLRSIQNFNESKMSMPKLRLSSRVAGKGMKKTEGVKEIHHGFISSKHVVKSEAHLILPNGDRVEKNIKSNPLKEKVVARAANEKVGAQNETIQNVSHEEEKKGIVTKRKVDAKNLRQTGHNEHISHIADISAVQNPNRAHTPQKSESQHSVDSLKNGTLQTLGKGKKQKSDNKVNGVHFAQLALMEKSVIEPLVLPLFNEKGAVLPNDRNFLRSPLKVAANEQPLHKEANEDMLRMRNPKPLKMDPYAIKRESPHRSHKAQSGLKSEVVDSSTPHPDQNQVKDENIVPVAQMQHISQGYVANVLSKSTPHRPQKVRVTPKRVVQQSAIKSPSGEKENVAGKREVEQMPHMVFEVERPQVKIASKAELQSSSQTQPSQDSNGNELLQEAQTHTNEQLGAESEVLGMTHFDERDLLLQKFQKEVRFFKIDQARVQIRMQNDQLQLAFLSQSPLVTDGVEEYVEHVMQEHGFENYLVRLKDRKRDLLIHSQKSTTSHEARSMIDVKV